MWSMAERRAGHRHHSNICIWGGVATITMLPVTPFLLSSALRNWQLLIITDIGLSHSLVNQFEDFKQSNNSRLSVWSLISISLIISSENKSNFSLLKWFKSYFLLLCACASVWLHAAQQLCSWSSFLFVIQNQMISYFPYFSSKMEAIKREGKLCENENTDVIFVAKI